MAALNGHASAAGLAAQLDDEDDGKPAAALLEDDDDDKPAGTGAGGWTGGRRSSAVRRSVAGGRGGASLASQLDDDGLENELLADEQPSASASAAAAAARAATYKTAELSDDSDNDFDVNKVMRAIANGKLTAEMNSSEEKIWGGAGDEPSEFVEFREPEGPANVTDFSSGTPHVHAERASVSAGPVAIARPGSTGSTGTASAGASSSAASRADGQRGSTALNKCKDPRCMSFASRPPSSFCLRHLYQDSKEPAKAHESALLAHCDELVATEEKYNKALFSALHFFHDRLRLLAKGDRPLLANTEVDKIFLNLAEIHRVSDEFLSDLKDMRARRRLITHVAAVFLHYVTAFDVYRKYCAGQAAAIQALSLNCDRSQPFRQFMELNERCENATLASLLALPTSILARYQQRLNEIDAVLPVDNAMKPDVKEASKRLTELSNAIDASSGITEAHRKVQLIQDQFDRDVKYVDLVSPSRMFVRSGQLKKKYAKSAAHQAGLKPYTFFLFSDLLVIARASKNKGSAVRYQVKHHIPLYEVAVKGVQLAQLEFEIKVRKKKPITIVTANPQERDEWVQAIDARISETAKNPPPNSPLRAGARSGSAGESDFALMAAADTRASKAGDDDDNDFASGQPSKNFTPINTNRPGQAPAPSPTNRDVKSAAASSSSSSSSSSAAAGTSLAAQAIGAVEVPDDDPDAATLFSTDALEPTAVSKNLYMVI